MNKYTKLFSNSIIFAIGNLGSKMITFLMVPLYTRFLTTADYGRSDVLSTLVDLFTPVLTLSVIDAVFRFAMDEKSDNRKVLTNGLVISLMALILMVLGAPILVHFHYGFYVFILTYFSALESMLQQFARGIGKSRLYAITGILMTLVTVISNIILIVSMGWALNGYLASMLIAQIAGLIFLTISLRAWRYIDFNFINLNFIKRMLVYSIPIIPNSVSWWLSNSANKVFISLMLGATANGIYAVANKIPSLISVFQQIFTQAWQISAVEEFQSKNAGKFFSNVLRGMSSLLIVGVAVITIIAKPMVLLISTPAYIDAWKIVPWLGLAVLYSSISAFLGTVYTASMKTGDLFRTTLVGAIINVVFNLALIPMFGVVGAGIGAAISFLCVMLLRIRGTRKFVKIHVNGALLCISQLLILFEIFSLNYLRGISGVIVSACLVLILCAIHARPVISVLINQKRKQH